MRWMIFTALIVGISAQTAQPQTNTGTVLYVNIDKYEVTIAADSRTNPFKFTEGHVVYSSPLDSECKISVFGEKFLFTVAGLARTGKWDAHAVARQVWKETASRNGTATGLVNDVAEAWASRMTKRSMTQPSSGVKEVE